MYSIDTIKTSINTYYELEKKHIIGKQRIKFITSVFGIHMNTLYNWINIYYNKITKIFNFLSYKSNFTYNNTKVTQEIEIFIVQSIDNNNNFNIKKIKKNIFSNFNVSLSKPTIYHILHKHNLTFKNLIVKNVPYTDEKLNEFKKELKIKVNNVDNLNIISYDEMSIYLNSKPYKGWSKKGSRCIIKTKNKSIFNKRYTVGMGINKKGVIDFTIVEGALNGNKFNHFIKKLNKHKDENISIFMDNASIHKNSNFKKYINETNLNVIYNIPYHSELNPIEYIFSLLRKQILSCDNFTRDNVIKIIVDFKKNINKNTVLNIFNKCFNIIKSF